MEQTFSFEDVDNEISFDEVEEIIEDIIEEEPKAEPVAEEEVVEHSEAEKAEFLRIYDAIMFEDKYEKEYKLGKKYKVVFTTRSADSDMKISRQLDGMNFSTMHAFQTMSAILTMSHSLVAINGKDCSTLSVQDRYKFLREKSSHLIEMLADKMIDFDHIVRSVLEYGELNF